MYSPSACLELLFLVGYSSPTSGPTDSLGSIFSSRGDDVDGQHIDCRISSCHRTWDQRLHWPITSYSKETFGIDSSHCSAGSHVRVETNKHKLNTAAGEAVIAKFNFDKLSLI